MKFKKWLLAAALTFSFSGNSFATAATDITVNVDGNAIAFPDAKPYIDSSSSRTMIPVRFVSEKLGAAVQWDEATRTVKMDKGGKQIALRIGEKKATVAGKQITFDAAAVIRDSRTFVPLRFVSEAYGAQVEWMAAERLVEISTKAAPATKNVSGKDYPVNEKDPTFQAFHKSLTIKNGILTGKVPDTSLYIAFSVYFKEGHAPIADVLGAGESFSFKVEDIKAMGITIIDRTKKKELAGYAYRSLPDLNVESTKGGE
ncbi:MAG: copper amine oxidase N-terminal domain-containing protein [Limisphaerales bacterium]